MLPMLASTSTVQQPPRRPHKLTILESRFYDKGSVWNGSEAREIGGEWGVTGDGPLRGAAVRGETSEHEHMSATLETRFL